MPLIPDQPVVKPPRAPAGLSADARRLWRELWLNAPWVVPGVDNMVLELVCQGYDDVASYRQQIAADGKMIPGSKGQQVAHPLIAEIRVAQDQLQSWAGYLALRPDMRARLGLTVAKTVSKLDELEAKRRYRRSAAGGPPVPAEVVTDEPPDGGQGGDW